MWNAVGGLLSSLAWIIAIASSLVSMSLVSSLFKCCPCFKNTNLMSLPSLKFSRKVCRIMFKSLKRAHKELCDLASTDITGVISWLKNLHSPSLTPTLLSGFNLEDSSRQPSLMDFRGSYLRKGQFQCKGLLQRFLPHTAPVLPNYVFFVC